MIKNLDISLLPSPCYVVDEVALERNLQVIDRVQQATGAKVLLALKGFAMWSLFPLVKKYLHGVTASSLNEATLGKFEFGREVHAYAPAYSDHEIDAYLETVDHLSFNSFGQWHRFKEKLQGHSRKPQAAIRINPEHSEVKTSLYDPCQPYSRLGVCVADFENQDLSGITGLHFHTLCELNADALERTLAVVEQKFSPYFEQLSWFNFGGGHHITQPDYDLDLLVSLIARFKKRYGLQVYLEPGEAVALNTGVLVATVLDVIGNKMSIAILDTSASTHMPDVLEMPYRPEIQNAGKPDQKKYTYRLGGLTCLAGDIIGDYSFDEPLKIGDKLVFGDMAHYSMVKNTTFNGVNLPAIAIHHSLTGQTRVVKEFGYQDYRGRLS